MKMFEQMLRAALDLDCGIVSRCADFAPLPFSGSVVENCDGCGERVWVGAKLKDAQPLVVLCTVCLDLEVTNDDLDRYYRRPRRFDS